jgi:N6-adenosine-specific RNA methylase IME4
MTASDDFTRIATDLLINARDLANWGIETGNTTPDKIRLTVAARQEAAIKLTQAGMSQRDAARVLGVSKGTIQNDVENNCPENGQKLSKAERRAARERELADKICALPQKKYGVIVADPEWRFEPWSRETGMDRAADNHYPTSTVCDIAARDVQSIAADDCVLFLWATVPILPGAFLVLSSWGFDYKSHCVWIKDNPGTGYWFRNQHELLLVGTRGKIPAPAPGEQWRSVIDADRGAHSAKPEIFLRMIEEYFPTLPKIELNRRGPPRAGWDAWGNEADAKIDDTAPPLGSRAQADAGG